MKRESRRRWEVTTLLLVLALAAAVGCARRTGPIPGSANGSSPNPSETAMTGEGSQDTARFPPCRGPEIAQGPWVNSNRPLSDGGPWTMVAEVWIRNHYGPDCSLKAYPTVVFKEWGEITYEDGHPTRREITRGQTVQTRSDTLPEEWVDLPWTPADRYDEDRLGHFRIYTTQLDAHGNPCSPERILPGEQLDITIPSVSDKPFPVEGTPTDEGPQLSSCDGRIAVTPFAQIP
jgi:hypothetical protein